MLVSIPGIEADRFRAARHWRKNYLKHGLELRWMPALDGLTTKGRLLRRRCLAGSCSGKKSWGCRPDLRRPDKSPSTKKTLRVISRTMQSSFGQTLARSRPRLQGVHEQSAIDDPNRARPASYCFSAELDLPGPTCATELVIACATSIHLRGRVQTLLHDLPAAPAALWAALWPDDTSAHISPEFIAFAT